MPNTKPSANNVTRIRYEHFIRRNRRIIIIIATLLGTTISLLGLSIVKNDLEKHKLFYDILIGLFVNAIFSITTYVLVNKSYGHWLGYNLKEIPQFDAQKFLLEVRKSNIEIIILETFIKRLLDNDHKSEFRDSLEHFVGNCYDKGIDNFSGKIKVLILQPFSEASERRYYQLDKTLESLHKFQDEMHGLLQELQGLQDDINRFAKRKFGLSDGAKENFFQVRISHISPPFSFYYCDKYASLSYYDGMPSVEAPQLIFLNASESEVAAKQLNVFYSLWNRAVLLPEDYRRRAETIDIQVIKDFKELTIAKDRGIIREKLCNISSLCKANMYNAVELVNYLESNFRKSEIDNKHDDNKVRHYNVFGTGGDKTGSKTINISTIASILATHYESSEYGIESISIQKAGTLAVTCNVGSQQFYHKLQEVLLEDKGVPKYIKNRIFLDYNARSNSRFLPITYFGYIYREVVRIVRRELESKEGFIDIFKIIFPTANLTGYDGVINGVSRKEYVDFFKIIYKEKRKTGIIFFNSEGVDEIYRGVNTIYYFKNGEMVYDITFSISFLEENDARMSYTKFFNESDALVHVRRFFHLFKPNVVIKKCIKETICYNIALIVQLSFLVNKSFTLSSAQNKEFLGEEMLQKLKTDIYSFFFPEPNNSELKPSPQATH